ncbi:hypothetical protein SAMN04489742_3245 [Arthrobacter crystallopoietes]|uniref:Uncharacterized protein n=1 Tax=Crystallibacter crystallopoietes TaxID=37928 RepID=A0A1H1F493_9MICC|nr:hypothetical protein AC20117_01250 [Arthrobacter crystallopoietes]SDQ95803.1 hypothetical protein SAMN04489742_3245 [Arthrobacter crystallopoietes]
MPRTPADQRHEYGSPATNINILEYCNGLLADAPESAQVRLDLLLERTYRMITAQAERSFDAARNHDDAAAFRELLSRPDFRGPLAWDFLAGSPSRTAVRRRITHLLQSEWVRDALLKNAAIDAATIHELVNSYRSRAQTPNLVPNIPPAQHG